MSITSEITRINSNIAAAYSKCNDKGATLPETQNSANLANTIDSIQTGSDNSALANLISGKGDYIVVPDTVVAIREFAFAAHTMNAIFIPTSVKNIGGEAFMDCRGLKTVKYGGSQSDWNKININNTGNSYLLGADMVYNATPKGA